MNAEAERAAERERYERERHDAAESELRARAEALIVAVTVVRNLPPTGSNSAKAQGDQYRFELNERIYPALVAVGSMHPSLWNAAHKLAQHAVSGAGLPVRINNRVDFVDDLHDLLSPTREFQRDVDSLLGAVDEVVSATSRV